MQHCHLQNVILFRFDYDLRVLQYEAESSTEHSEVCSVPSARGTKHHYYLSAKHRVRPTSVHTNNTFSLLNHSGPNRSHNYWALSVLHILSAIPPCLFYHNFSFSRSLNEPHHFSYLTHFVIMMLVYSLLCFRIVAMNVFRPMYSNQRLWLPLMLLEPPLLLSITLMLLNPLKPSVYDWYFPAFHSQFDSNYQ